MANGTHNAQPSSAAGIPPTPRHAHNAPAILPRLNARFPLFEFVLLLVAAAIGWATFHTYAALNEINRRAAPAPQFQQAEETRTVEPVEPPPAPKPQDPMELLHLTTLLDVKNRFTDYADQMESRLNAMRGSLQAFARERDRTEIRNYRAKSRELEQWLRKQRENYDARRQQSVNGWLASLPASNHPPRAIHFDELLVSTAQALSNYLAVVPLTEGQPLSPDLIRTKLERMTEPEQSMLSRTRESREQAEAIETFVKLRQTPPPAPVQPPLEPKVTTVVRPIGDGGKAIIAQFTTLQADARERLQPLFYVVVSALIVQCIVTIVAFYNRIVVLPLRQKLIEDNTAVEHQRKLAHFARLATGLAHEIRNPLTAISVRLFTLQKNLNKGTSEHSDASLIRNEIDRLEQILKNFLKLARPSEPKLIPLTAEAAFREVVDLLAPQLRRRGVALRLDPATTPASFQADPLQLKQVLINLIQNAADSIEDDTGTVTLHARLHSTGRGTATDRRVILEVEDTGAGITPEVQERLFDPFFSTKDNNGTGLGLPIAAKIIEQHKGTLDFETRLGHGTVFRITLPASGQ